MVNFLAFQKPFKPAQHLNFIIPVPALNCPRSEFQQFYCEIRTGCQSLVRYVMWILLSSDFKSGPKKSNHSFVVKSGSEHNAVLASAVLKPEPVVGFEK